MTIVALVQLFCNNFLQLYPISFQNDSMRGGRELPTWHGVLWGGGGGGFGGSTKHWTGQWFFYYVFFHLTMGKTRVRRIFCRQKLAGFLPKTLAVFYIDVRRCVTSTICTFYQSFFYRIYFFQIYIFFKEKIIAIKKRD